MKYKPDTNHHKQVMRDPGSRLTSGAFASRLLVKGDPAGGKTTFAKQLLTWIMPGSRHEYG